MVEIVKVTTKKQQKQFLDFPLKLYKGNKNFVPPLYGDEKKMFREDYLYHDNCEDVFFLAYRGKEVVGRISGILQKAYNAKTNEKRVRFVRFDSIDDQEVANGLFKAVEDWAREKGMDTVSGPSNYSDQEREGLLVEGFDQLATFEEQYNAPYYEKLVKNCGYETEVEWVERKLYAPKERDEKFEELAMYMLKRNKLHMSQCKNVNEFLEKYENQIFDLLNSTYSGLYGTVAYTEAMKKQIMSSFKMVVDLKYTAAILDENDRVVSFGVVLPSMAHGLRGTTGKLSNPITLFKLLKSIKKPHVIDLALIGVLPEYENKGVTSVFIAFLLGLLRNGQIEYAETNLNLTTNYAILNQWKHFDSVLHKKRRAYKKVL